MERGTDLWKPCGVGGSYTMIQVFAGGYSLPADPMRALKELRMRYIPYKEEIKQVSVISFSHAGFSAFDEFVVHISPLDGRHVQRYSEDYSSMGNKATLAEVYEDLASSINCNTRSQVYAAVTPAGLTISTRYSGISFGLSGEFRKDPSDTCNVGCVTTTSKTTVDYSGGSGSGADLRRLMFNARADTGSMNGWGSTNEFGFNELPYPSIYGDRGESLTAKFDFYFIEYKNGQNDDGEQAKYVLEVFQTLIVAFPKTVTNNGAQEFVTIMEALTEGTFRTSSLD